MKALIFSVLITIIGFASIIIGIYKMMFTVPSAKEMDKMEETIFFKEKELEVIFSDIMLIKSHLFITRAVSECAASALSVIIHHVDFLGTGKFVADLEILKTEPIKKHIVYFDSFKKIQSNNDELEPLKERYAHYKKVISTGLSYIIAGVIVIIIGIGFHIIFQ